MGPVQCDPHCAGHSVDILIDDHQRVRTHAFVHVRLRHTSMAAADPASLRNSNFCILPVDVFGNSQNTTARGTLKPARWALQCATSSAALTVAPAFNSTKAQGVSPQRGSGFATTAAARTAGWRYSTSSISMLEIFSPPEMMMSLLRSLIRT